MVISQYLQSLIIVMAFTKDASPQRIELNCSPFNTNEASYYYPAGIVDVLTLCGGNNVIPSSGGVSYIYPVPSAQINCSGTVTALQYTYQRIDLEHVGTKHLVFKLLIFQQIGSQFKLLKKTDVHTDPTSDECRGICCSSEMLLNKMDQFEFPVPNFAFGVMIPPSLREVLIGFSNTVNTVEQYLVALDFAVGSTTELTNSSLVLDEGLRVLTFRITPNMPTSAPTTSQSTHSGTDATTSQSTHSGTDATTPATSQSTRSGTDTTATTMPTYGVGNELGSDFPSPDRNDDTNQTGGLVGGIVTVTVVIGSVSILLVVVIFLRHRCVSRFSRKEFRPETSNGTGNTETGTGQSNVLQPTLREYQNDNIGSHASVYYQSFSWMDDEVNAIDNPVAYKELKDEDIYKAPSNDVNSLYSQLKELKKDKVTRETVKLGSMLGSGQFGDVFKGVWMRSDGEAEVAIKTLKQGAGSEDRVKFLQEAAIMGQFKHRNVVTMHGVVTVGEPVLLVLEILKKGDLRQHLLSMASKNVEINFLMLLTYCCQIASGMAYLSNKAFIHRDLAARNILVSEYDICKIADFGMSRNLMDETYYVSHGGLIPVKWTAPEALYFKKYSTASDVWSFGVVMYEVWSLGQKPFYGIDNNKVMKMVDSGYRLLPPSGCPSAMYNIMIACWESEVSRRPDFGQISRQLSLFGSRLPQCNDQKYVLPVAAKLEL